MSIYKEEKNKKDCFEHLISLQGVYIPQRGATVFIIYILYILFYKGNKGKLKI